MGLVGVLYLLFERSILSDPTSNRQSSPAAESLPRTILGVQVGLIALSMIVTSSSVASLQAKRGLPLGNQVVGWLVLSTSFMSSLSASCCLPDLTSCFTHGAFPPQLTTKKPLSPPSSHYLPYLLPLLHHPHNLLRRPLLLHLLRSPCHLGAFRTPYLQLRKDCQPGTSALANNNCKTTLYRPPGYIITTAIAKREFK